MNFLSPEYHRNSKEWHNLVGKSGIVILSTQLKISTPELQEYLPYCFLIVELNNGKKIEIMGEAKTLIAQGDKVRLELRKIAQPDLFSVIPYGLKAVKVFD
jgi:uncharacterized OB-fold protein